MAAFTVALYLCAIASLGLAARRHEISATLTSEEKTCEDICNAVYKDAPGMNYKSSCISYCEKASGGEDPCDTCKYVTDQSGYHKACRFFMTAFLDESDPDCYHKPLNHDGCPAEKFLDERCGFVGWGVVKQAQKNVEACQHVYKEASGMTYEASCTRYVKLAAEGGDACDVCKYVTDQSGYHKACRFFMTSFLDEKDGNCYHQPLHHDACPEENFMDENCGFVGWDEMRKAIDSGLILH